MSADARGFPKEVSRAEFYFDRGCQLGSGVGCNNAGLYASKPLLETGHFPNLGKTIAYYEKACDLREPIGCSNLASLYEAGRVTGGADRAKAQYYYDRSCRLGHELSCVERDRLARDVHIYIHR
jgi:TPR repeat protein